MVLNYGRVLDGDALAAAVHPAENSTRIATPAASTCFFAPSSDVAGMLPNTSTLSSGRTSVAKRIHDQKLSETTARTPAFSPFFSAASPGGSKNFFDALPRHPCPQELSRPGRSSRTASSFLTSEEASNPQQIADQAAASARAAYAAYLRGEEKVKQAHDALLAATSAATMAQVSALSNAKVSGSGRVLDLSCRFSVTHEVWHVGHSMTDSVRAPSCLSCMRNCLAIRSKVDSFW
ncbi:unnamed protein product [Amoebophrya sp. A120]|nr:unnamed protein product [Amoebophrya sp. A120]|eukprot:GSA120T00020683001.1